MVEHPGEGIDLALVELAAATDVTPIALYDPSDEANSGGPALIENHGKPRIAGVSSWQDHDGPLSTYGSIEHYARVSTQLRWIRDVCAS